jgi:hypothetical protein
MSAEGGVCTAHVECSNSPVFQCIRWWKTLNCSGPVVTRNDMQGIWFCPWNRARLDVEVEDRRLKTRHGPTEIELCAQSYSRLQGGRW